MAVWWNCVDATPGGACITCCPERNNILKTRYSAARFIASCCGVGGMDGFEALFDKDNKASRKHNLAETSKVSILCSSLLTTLNKSASRRVQLGFECMDCVCGGLGVALARRHAAS